MGMSLMIGTSIVTGTGQGSFSPLSLGATLAAWYDPSSISGYFQLSNGTTAVAADGDPVGYEPDLSGKGNHLIQATAGLRPSYDATGINGLSALESDGGDILYNGAITWTDNSGGAMYVVYDASVQGTPFSVWDSFGDIEYWAFGAGDSYFGTFRTARVTAGDIGLGGTTAMLVCIRSGSDYKACKNGTEVYSTTASWQAPTKIAALAFENAGAVGGITGMVGERIVLNANPSDAQHAAITSYLRGKWGV